MLEDAHQLEVCLKSLEEGEPDVLVRLFDYFRPRLLKVVTLYMDRAVRGRADAGDVLQEAYVDASQQLANYVQRKDEIDFYVWLRGITLQRLYKFHRFHRAQRRTVSGQVALPDKSSLVLGQQLVSPGSSPSLRLRREELRKQVERAVGHLTETDREIILMRHYEDLTNREVAQALGLELSTASMRYGRALERLRAALQADDVTRGSL